MTLLPPLGYRSLAGLLAVGVLTGCQGSDPTVAEFGSGPTVAESSAASGAPGSSPIPTGPVTAGTGDGATPDPTAPDPTATTAPRPSSSIDEAARAAAEQQIRSAVQKDWEIWMACSASPAGCDPAARLAEVRTTTGRYYLDDLARLRRWAADGQVVRQPEGHPDENFVVTESVAIDPDGRSATAVTCTGDGRARYTTGAGGVLTLVAGTDAQGYNRAENYLVLDGATWKIDGFKILEESLLPEGRVLCER